MLIVTYNGQLLQQVRVTRFLGLRGYALQHPLDDRSLKTSIYRKPTHTGSYLNYESNHPISAKRSVISSLLKRTENITLGGQEVQREKSRVKKELQANNYPAAMIKRVKTKLNRTSTTKGDKQSKGKTTKGGKLTIASIPYVSGLSEAISRNLAPLDIKTVSRAKQRKWNVMKGVKDALPADSQPGVVYALGCRDCSQVYIGETTRTAKQRIKEHKDHTKKGKDDMSAVAKHVIDTGHKIHWKPRIITTEKKPLQRKVREALTIHQVAKRNQDHLMNLDKGTELSNLWLV